MPSLRTLGGIGAVLTCPCHAVPLALLLGGTAGGAWITHDLPALLVAFGAVFVLSLWLMLRPERAAGAAGAAAGAAAACDTCAAPTPNDGHDRAPLRGGWASPRVSARGA